MDILKDLYTLFKPEIPAGEAGAALYFDFGQVAGHMGILDNLLNTVAFSDAPTCQVVSGLRGCGKSSLLGQLGPRAHERGMSLLSLRLDLGDLYDSVQPPGALQILSYALACLAERFVGEDGPAGLRDKALEAVQSFGALLGAAVDEVQVSLPGLTANIRAPSAIRDRLLEYEDGDPEQLLRRIHDQFRDLTAAILDHHGHKKLLLVLDGLEKFVPQPMADWDAVRQHYAVQEPIYRIPGMHAFRLPCHTVVTAPPSLFLRSVLDGFDGVPQMISMVKTRSLDRQPDEQGMESLVQLVIQRHPQVGPLLFGDPLDELERLVRNSGGSPRTLIQAIHMGMTLNGPQGEFPIPASVWRDVLQRQAREIGNKALDPDMQLMLDLHLPATSAHLAREDVTQFEATMKLVDQGLLLGYPNGEPWFGVHPMLLPALKEFAARRGSAGEQEASTP